MSTEIPGSDQTHFRLAEIDVNQTTFDEKIAGVFRFESEQKGKKGPTLVILAEIASTLYVYEQLLDRLNAAAEQTRRLMSAVDTDPMVRFEKMTQRLNEAIVAFTAEEPTAISWNRVNIFVLELSERCICLTGIGRMANMFLQKQASGGVKTFDLFGSLEQPSEINPEKIFASFICGDIHPGDIFFAGSLNFERLRQELSMKERLMSLPPVTAALEIRQDLERRNIPDHFCGLVIANVQLAQKSPTLVPKTAPVIEVKADSIRKMHEEEQKTQDILSPTVTPLQDLANTTSLEDWKKRGHAFVSQVAHKIRSLARREPSAHRNGSPHDALTLASLRGMSAGHGNSVTAQTKKKIYAGGGLIVLILAGGIWLNQARKHAADQELWNSVFQQATDRKNRAEGDLIYGNEAHAAQLVKEAVTLLGQLDEKTKERKQTKEQFQKELAEVQQKLKKENRVDQPTEIFQGTGPLSTLNFFQDGLYTIENQSTSSLVRINLTNKETIHIALPSETPAIRAAAPLKEGLLLFTADQITLFANPTQSKVGIVPFGSVKATSTQSAVPYTTRLYTLDPAGQMIWRYTVSGNSASQEREYLKHVDPALIDAVDMAIDSNVYVALKNGQIVKYLSGDRQDWNLRTVEPSLTNINSMWAVTDIDRIVVADAAGKRVIIFDKLGNLVSQIVSNAFQSPSKVTVDPKTKKIYVLDGSKIFQLDLP